MRYEGVRCYASFPLVVEDQVTGAVTFRLAQPGEPPQEDREIATDVTLGTLRILMTVHGRKPLAALVGFVEVTIALLRQGRLHLRRGAAPGLRGR